MSALDRRTKLLAWMAERPDNQGLTARQIVDVSCLYDDRQHYRYDRCFDDLTTLTGLGLVCRKGRPARWWLA